LVYYPNGMLKQQGSYEGGKTHGFWLYFSEEGFVNLCGHYNRGKAEGFWTVLYPSGSVAGRILFQGGEQRGPSWIYNEEGVLTKEFKLTGIPQMINR